MGGMQRGDDVSRFQVLERNLPRGGMSTVGPYDTVYYDCYDYITPERRAALRSGVVLLYYDYITPERRGPLGYRVCRRLHAYRMKSMRVQGCQGEPGGASAPYRSVSTCPPPPRVSTSDSMPAMPLGTARSQASARARSRDSSNIVLI
jgi:hypothetical protein